MHPPGLLNMVSLDATSYSQQKVSGYFSVNGKLQPESA